MDKSTIDYNNLLIILLRISNFDLSEIIDTFNFTEENFSDLNLIDKLISKISTSSITLSSINISYSIDIIFSKVYY